MTYTTEHITRALKHAREARALSQRALGVQAGVPQGHISKIENGAVDLRTSSLVELARVLGLELMLVPRKSVTAVQALVRSTKGLEENPAFTAPGELSRLQEKIERLVRKHPTVPEVARVQRQVNELAHARIPRSRLAVIRAVEDLLGEYSNDRERTVSLEAAFERIVRLRHELAPGSEAPREGAPAHPAYRLDEDEDG